MAFRDMMLHVRCTQCGETSQEQTTWAELGKVCEAIAAEACCAHPQRVLVGRSMFDGVHKVVAEGEEPEPEPKRGLTSRMFGASEDQGQPV